MIGKQITGRSFGGCVGYILEKDNAVVIDVNGVRMQNAKTITQDFNMQRKMRPGLGKAVGHLVLSWSKEDLPKLTSAIMAEHAREYMEKMGISNTQYVIVRHNDRDHPHAHIVFNRVDNNGQTITDKNNFARNIKVCKEMTLKHGFHLGEGKDQVNRKALRGKEKLRYELYDAIKFAVKQSTNWKELEAHLKDQDVRIQYKYRSGTNEVQGVSFEKEGFKMKGSAIDRSFSYSNLNAQLTHNNKVEEYLQIPEADSASMADQIKEALRFEEPARHPQGTNILEILLQPEFTPSGPDPVGDADIQRRKRKKMEHEQSQGLSR